MASRTPILLCAAALCGGGGSVVAAAAAASAAATEAGGAGEALSADDACLPAGEGAGDPRCGMGLLQQRAGGGGGGGDGGPNAAANKARVPQQQHQAVAGRRAAEAVGPARDMEQRGSPWGGWPSWSAPTPRPLTTELVSEVYTYGAPATKAEPFRNAGRADGCFGGLRSYTEDRLGAFKEIKQVDAAAMNNYYPHAWTNSVCLHWAEDSYYTPCNKVEDGHPDWPQRGAQVYEEWRLHQEDDYVDRLNQVTVDGKMVADEEPFKTARLFSILAFKSYDTTQNTKAAVAEKMPGWRLVGKSVDVHGQDEDPVMLAQDAASLDCAVVFTGTNDFGELTTSTTQYGTGYCGFENVHVGYRNELWTITGQAWQPLLPMLEQCKRVICVGHSLGGALCEVFAACANSGNFTDPDYKRLAWTPGTPALMPELAA